MSQQHQRAGRHERACQEGFTLIELLIVVIIVMILAAIAIPTYLGQREKAKDAAVKEAVHSLQVGVQSYAVDHGDTHPASGALDALKSGYVDAWPDDAYSGGSMGYSATAEAGSYAYVASGSAYRIIGWLGNGTFEVPGGADGAVVPTFMSRTDSLIKLSLAFYAKNGRWPRSWAPYCYTDLGLDPADYAGSTEGVIHKVGAPGSRYDRTPAT